MKPLAIISAGGTMDAVEYDFESGHVITFGKPPAEEIVKKAMPGIASENITFMSPFQKDSDDMNDGDRQQLLEACKRCNCDRIIITHGSGTMMDTGALLAAHLKEKTIVLTGALPYTHDPVYGAFNMGCAITACKLLAPGVYIVTSGQIVPVDGKEVKKVKSGKVTYFAER